MNKLIIQKNWEWHFCSKKLSPLLSKRRVRGVPSEISKISVLPHRVDWCGTARTSPSVRVAVYIVPPETVTADGHVHTHTRRIPSLMSPYDKNITATRRHVIYQRFPKCVPWDNLKGSTRCRWILRKLFYIKLGKKKFKKNNSLVGVKDIGVPQNTNYFRRVSWS